LSGGGYRDNNKMGQYYGERKIGTCERMYYMRQDEAEELASKGEQDNDGIKFSEYLSDNITAFRFPFPSEDKKLGDKYNQSFSIPAGVLTDIGHRDICISNTPKNMSGHNVNIFIPCIYSQEFKNTGLKLSMGGAGEQFLDILYTGNRYRDNDTKTGLMKRKTIFACSRCEQEQRFSDEDIEKLKTHATKYYEYLNQSNKNEPDEHKQAQYNEAMEIIKRIS